MEAARAAAAGGIREDDGAWDAADVPFAKLLPGLTPRPTKASSEQFKQSPEEKQKQMFLNFPAILIKIKSQPHE